MVGKGYRFSGPVRVIDACYPNSDFEHRYPIGIERERSSGWGERSSLAVLPLFLVGTVTDDQGLGFADALVSRLGNLQGVDLCRLRRY